MVKVCAVVLVGRDALVGGHAFGVVRLVVKLFVPFTIQVEGEGERLGEVNRVTGDGNDGEKPRKDNISHLYSRLLMWVEKWRSDGRVSSAYIHSEDTNNTHAKSKPACHPFT
jgi:hypothetical protein